MRPVTTVVAERTFRDKVTILHGVRRWLKIAACFGLLKSMRA